MAETAGVAVSTVSRVLNGGYASAKVRERVKAAVRDLGYAPSTAARSLVTGRSGCLGVVVRSSRGPWLMEILGGIEEELAQSRHSVLLASLFVEDRYDSSAVRDWITQHRVDGIIFVRYGPRERQLLRSATRAGLPIVLLAPDEAARADFVVRCRNVEAGRIVAGHLHDLGHRRIAFAGGPRESMDSRDRLDGIKKELAVRGAKIRSEDARFEKSYRPEAGIEAAERFLARRVARRATAVVLGNDAMAMGFMRTVLGSGLRIPDDVSVVGFDGIPEAELFWPSLTTALQPMRTMGAVGCRALLDRISNGAAEGRTTVEYAAELACRESTGAPRSAKRTTSRDRREAGPRR